MDFADMTLDEFRKELQLPPVPSTADVMLRATFAVVTRLDQIIDWGSSCYHKLDEIQKTLHDTYIHG